ncbi:DUF4349 domain-containing protein [Oscillospiraceae bacterium 50-16]
MKRKWFAACLAGVLLLAGCGGGKAQEAITGDAMAPAGSMMTNDFSGGGAMPEPEAPEEEGWDMPGALESDASVYQNPRAKLIRRAELDIQTEQFDQSVQALNTLVLDCGGYFENSSVYGGGYRDAYARRHGEYIVRVPAERYTAFLSGAGDLGYLTSSSESTEDVGEQYYDTEARLKTQRTKQERLLALLERAETMEDIIALEGALSDVELQIELYSSDLNRYDALISYATIQVYLNEVGQITQDVGETSSLGERMAAGVQSSFQGLVQGGQDLLIWMSYHLFAVLILAVLACAGVIAGRKKLEKRRLRRQGAGDQSEPPQ